MVPDRAVGSLYTRDEEESNEERHFSLAMLVTAFGTIFKVPTG
jgi:hypothetical protein